MSRCPFFLTFLPLLAAGAAWAQTITYEEAPHFYFSAPLHDPAVQLDEDLQAGRFRWPEGTDLEAVRSVLRRLKIPESSQTLVFSKTSVQKDRITPTNPRAIYFNDECYAGWVPGGLMEMASIDPVLGPIFYTLDFHRPDRPAPRLDRPQACLDCHGSNMTNRLPGVMIRSVFPDKDGSVLFQAGTSLIDHTSPINIRWGGWYVTGTHGSSPHRGNAIAAPQEDGAVTLNTAKGANRQTLESFFPVKNYPQPGSDIVALMVMEHQVMMHSRLTEASYDVRAALIQQRELRKELGEPPTDALTGTASIVASSHAGKILEALLFKDEAEFPEDGIAGSPDFQRDFRHGRPATADGKSLAEFHLGNRLLRNRCSYLIYSRQWAALPAPLLELVYRRLFDILTPENPPADFSYLSLPERRSILEILRATLPGLPGYWKV
jgi:hypothetical protein